MSNLQRTKLDDLNIEFTKNVLHLSKQSLDVYKLISLNVRKIKSNHIGYKFFAYSQKIFLEYFILHLCKIFETKKTFELYSIPAMLEFIKSEKIRAFNLAPISPFAKEYECRFKKRLSAIENLKGIYKTFTDVHQQSIKMCKSARNKLIAHPEFGFQIDRFPSYGELERLLFFGIGFYETIMKVYFKNISPVDHKNDNRYFTSLKRVLQEIGIQELALNFEDS